MTRPGKRLDQGAEKCPPQGLPDRNAENSFACARLAHPGRGRSPCHSARLTPGPPGANAPRPAPDPPLHPPPTGAGLGWCGWHGSWWQRSARGRGKRSAFPFPARSGAEEHSPNHQRHCYGRGHRPCQVGTVTLGLPGAKAPGQRPPRPRRALRPRRVGRCLSWCGWHRSLWRRPARAGETQCVSCSRPEWGRNRVASMVGAIAPATALRWDQDRPGAKAPGQRPTRPWRALRSRRVGRWPALFPDLPVYRAPSRAGGETRCVS
jgi:hypothetical protein